MKCAILYTSHENTYEWDFSARFLDRLPDESILKNADILAYVNSQKVSATQIENYLLKFPNKNKRLFYSPVNGHTIFKDLDLTSEPQQINIKKKMSSSPGWFAGTLEAYFLTFPLLRSYDYVIHLNIDCYVTNHENIEKYMLKNFPNDISHHFSRFRSGPTSGLTTSSQIYRPNKFKYNHFENYKKTIKKYCSQKLFNDRKSLNQKDWVPTEIIMKKMLKDNEIKYNIFCEQKGRNDFGLLHSHDKERIKLLLNIK